MAVEKMKMMEVVGELSYIDKVIVDVLKSESVNMVSSQGEINKNNFVFSLEDEENLDKNIELNYIMPFEKDEEKVTRMKKANELVDFFGFKEIEEEYVKKAELSDDFDEFYNRLKEKKDRFEKIEEELKLIEGIKKNYGLFENVNINLSDLSKLKYFKSRFGILDKDGRFRLKKNYGNILAMIFHTGTIRENEVYLAIYPEEVSSDLDRILKSLNWQDVDIVGKYDGTAKEVIETLVNDEKRLKQEKRDIEEYRNTLIEADEENVKRTLASMLMIEKIEDVKKYMAKSNKYFYMSGWVGVSDLKKIEKVLFKYQNISVRFREPEEDEKIPTKLKNTNFFKPFELLLKMYGMPNYNEIDPTLFFGITYMILFGAMFGDLGQGAVFVLLGMYISRNKNKAYGKLLCRLGTSSMVFGLLYGSVFGNEEVLPSIWIRPFEEIDKTLAIAVAFGVILLVISYIVGLVNRLKNKEYEEAFFGKEGFCAFVIFMAMLGLGLTYAKNISFLPEKAFMGIIVISLILMIFKKQASKLIFKNQVHEKTESGYYIEVIFSLFETLMSILSNIISFIRVGAFAINHVGLFLAFQTVGIMIGNAAGNFIVLVIGNIVIIGLEGLIVFIQSLRLEYYEMFSKYYLGDGYEFIADKIKI